MQHLKAKTIGGLTDCPMTAQDLARIHEANSPYFDKLRKSGAENEMYMRGENLSDAQKKDIYGQGRIPFPMAIAADKINKFIAAERNNRTSFRLLAKKMDAEVKCALGNLRLKDVETSSNGEYFDSDMSQAAIGAKFGVGKIYVEKNKKGANVVRYKTIDYSKFGWDANSRTYEKNTDCAFWYEEIPTYRRDIEVDYGKKVAEGIEIGNQGRFDRRNTNYWGIANSDGKRDLDIINIYEHYQKVPRKRFNVVFDGEVDFVANSKKEAEFALKNFKVPYLVLGQPIPPNEIVPITELGIDKYVFTYNEILEYEETDYLYPPYIIDQSFQFEDEIWCLMDLLKSPAKFADKLISQIDYAFGADIKNGWEIVEPWLAQGIDISEAIRRVKAGEPLPVIHSGAVRSIPSKGANTQWMEMYGVMNQVLGELTGNIWGGQQPPGKQREAQGTVAMKMQQGSLVSALFMDNKRRTKMDLGKKLLWWLKKYDTAKEVLRVHGSDIKPEMQQLLQQKELYQPSPSQKGVGYVTMNEEEYSLSYLDDSDFELAISQTENSESQKQQRLMELQMLKQNGIMIPPQVWMEYMDVDYDLRQEIIQATQEAQKVEAQDKEDAKNLELIKATKGETEAGHAVGNEMASKSLQTNQQLNQGT